MTWEEAKTVLRAGGTVRRRTWRGNTMTLRQVAGREYLVRRCAPDLRLVRPWQWLAEDWIQRTEDRLAFEHYSPLVESERAGTPERYQDWEKVEDGEASEHNGT